jgi:hypothetical protein
MRQKTNDPNSVIRDVLAAVLRNVDMSTAKKIAADLREIHGDQRFRNMVNGICAIVEIDEARAVH